MLPHLALHLKKKATSTLTVLLKEVRRDLEKQPNRSNAFIVTKMVFNSNSKMGNERFQTNKNMTNAYVKNLLKYRAV